ncbi:MAG: hypothetical protein ABSD98_14350 [Candidatus Korobacteraceae bacterium]|jgi:hypothetical protein
MPRQTLSEELWQGLGNAVTDIRQKVVEEPMYGRTVTDGPESLQWPEPQDPEASLGSHTHIREIEQKQDLDLDR